MAPFESHNQQREDSPGIPEDIPGIFLEIRDMMTKGKQGLQKHRPRLLSRDDVWYGKSWQGSDGSVATKTTPGEVEHCVGEARSAIPEDDALPLWLQGGVVFLAPWSRFPEKSVLEHRFPPRMPEPPS